MSRPVLALLALLPIAGCGQPQSTETVTNTTTTNSVPSVTREEVPAPTPSPEPIVQAAIQTQPGPKGSRVSLNKVAVTGDIMTIQFTYLGGDGMAFADVDQVSVIDDATAKQIGVLKDNAGKYLASPVGSSGTRLAIDLGDKPSIVWFKLPAPPATSKTVSINLPDVVPFDGVPVTR